MITLWFALWGCAEMAPGNGSGLSNRAAVSVAPADTGSSDTDASGAVIDGHMTGGGSVWLGDVRITHGFTLRCGEDRGQNLQVNWRGARFHATEIVWTACTDDPAIDPSQPGAGFDTMQGEASGRFGGVDGALLEFTFTDAGEPGTSDHAFMVLTDANGDVVMAADSALAHGNHQAH